MNGLSVEPQRPRRRSLADQDVERVVLHRGVEDLLDRPVQPVDLVDEQHVVLVERGEDRRQIAGPLDGRAARVADVDPELAGDDRGQGRLAEAGRPVEQDVVGRLSPPPRRLEEDRQVGLDLALADVFVEAARSERPFDRPVGVVQQVGREDPFGVVGHPRNCYHVNPSIRTDVLRIPGPVRRPGVSPGRAFGGRP